MKVLFVCTGNAFRSPVAEALLRKFKPEVEVDSAGTNPVIPISESAREYLERENAVEYLKLSPEGLDEIDIGKYDFIVVMESRHREVILNRCPVCRDKILVWNIEDPYFLPPRHAEKIFEKIKQKVRELADSM